MNSPSLQILARLNSTVEALAVCNGPHSLECASLWILTNPPLTYCCVSHWIFTMRHQSLIFIRSWSQASWVLARFKSQERGAEEQEEKAVEKTCQGIPFIACQKICWIPDLCSVFIGLILGTKKIKDRTTPNSLGDSSWSSAESGAFGTYWELASPESLNYAHCCSPARGGFRGNKKREIVKELRFR